MQIGSQQTVLQKSLLDAEKSIKKFRNMSTKTFISKDFYFIPEIAEKAINRVIHQLSVWRKKFQF